MVMNDKSEKIVRKSFLVWNIQESKEHVSQDRLLRFRNSKNEKRGDRVVEHDDILKDGALQLNDFIILLHDGKFLVDQNKEINSLYIQIDDYWHQSQCRDSFGNSFSHQQ